MGGAGGVPAILENHEEAANLSIFYCTHVQEILNSIAACVEPAMLVSGFIQTFIQYNPSYYLISPYSKLFIFYLLQ